jgi:hypothetical protein
MGLQKYHADDAGPACSNGAVPWFAKWAFGPSLALVRNCPTPFGPRTVYVQGEPDTFFSQPAAIEYRRRVIRGYLTCEDSNWKFNVYRNGPDTVYPSTDTEKE